MLAREHIETRILRKSIKNDVPHVVRTHPAVLLGAWMIGLDDKIRHEVSSVRPDLLLDLIRFTQSRP
jgi:hypothetical protein